MATKREQALQLLELNQGCTDKEINNNFKKFALENHPDKLARLDADEKKDREDKFKKILAAREFLLKKDADIIDEPDDSDNINLSTAIIINSDKVIEDLLKSGVKPTSSNLSLALLYKDKLKKETILSIISHMEKANYNDLCNVELANDTEIFIAVLRKYEKSEVTELEISLLWNDLSYKSVEVVELLLEKELVLSYPFTLTILTNATAEVLEYTKAKSLYGKNLSYSGYNDITGENKTCDDSMAYMGFILNNIKDENIQVIKNIFNVGIEPYLKYHLPDAIETGSHEIIKLVLNAGRLETYYTGRLETHYNGLINGHKYISEDKINKILDLNDLEITKIFFSKDRRNVSLKINTEIFKKILVTKDHDLIKNVIYAHLESKYQGVQRLI